MCGPFHHGVLLCWTSLSVCLRASVAFNSNSSAYHRFENATAVPDREDGEGDFVRLRTSLPSYMQPIRPYGLRTHAEEDDYYYLPGPRHLRPSRLHRLLGSSFDPFWTSVDEPSEASEGRRPNSNLTSSPELREAAARRGRLLEEEAARLDLGALDSEVARAIRGWLVRSATCDLHQRWVDLGPTFWPRWLRRTDCKGAAGGQSCSFPPGMKCVRAQTTQVKVLVWTCLEIRDEGSKRTRGERSGGNFRTEEEEETIKKCLWRKVPYPVVTACRCSCE